MDAFGFDDDDDDLVLVAAMEVETAQESTQAAAGDDINCQTGYDGNDDGDDSDLILATMEVEEQALKSSLANDDFGASPKAYTESHVPEDEVPLAIPDVFPFPFTPYDIQKDFMKNLYACLDAQKIGVFESPTGTGKSLSLISGALKWLRDFQEKQKRELEALLSKPSNGNCENNVAELEKEEKELDWITEFAAKREQEEKLSKVKSEQENIQKREAKLKELQNSNPLARKRKHKSKLDSDFDELMSGASEDIKKACSEELLMLDKEFSETEGMGDEDEDLLVEDYNSEEEGDGKIKGRGKEGDEGDEEENVTKIYYCSRTHSQISQFVREVMKSPYDDVRVISLGSRQNMCINPAVRKLRSLTLINDKCLELKQKKSKKKPGCPFHKQELLHSFRDKALLEVSDIEQLVATGRQMKACPYFGARLAVPPAEVVALPYNTLLHKQTREACGIKLAGSIVIIDEAHNLLETINNIHSVEITGGQIVKAYSQLSQYEKKYRSRLKAKNLMYVRQILFVLSHLVTVLGGKVDYMADSQTNRTEDIKLLTINDLLFQGQLDNFNMFKLLRYCQRSQISKKLHGFVEKYQEAEVLTDSSKTPQGTGVTKFLQEIKASKMKTVNVKNQSEAIQGAQADQTISGFMSSPLMQIESFLDALTNSDKDGRVVVSKQVKLSHSSLKFLMLNPAIHFVSVLHEARAVVVAGGTMQPVSEFKDQLFHAAGISPNRVMEFSCGHVIPGRQLLPMAVAKGPSGITLDFTYQTRNKPQMIEELGRVILNICNVIPGGVVCFFPSYDYEKLVYTSWEKSSVLQKIQAKKKVFREPKRSGLADQVLTEYSDCIKRCSSWHGSLTGALLMCVVGGKMSEGINFSDDLGRCVVMVGLPYPNMYSPELKEKMSYLNANFAKDQEGRQAGQVYYENLCMKAVNQSIGRAIRHKDDYASILLLDQRYLRPSVTSKLPQWISKHMQKAEKFSFLMQALTKFFHKGKDVSS